ncbi:MAG: ABC transporter substrate-binding protein [Clostridiales Family XIII bacterium]|nr:ABC transporter substrate-binding protein [Clostridiales Family XIII bacterium]
MKRKIKQRSALAVLLAVLLALTFALSACGSDDKEDASSGTGGGDLETLTPGKLTIATGEPAWEPWVLNDDPESGEGFEAAVAYAVAEKLGYAPEDVVWVRTQFDEAIKPGPKDFDFNLQQYSITDERLEVVDFSSPYYKEALVVITKADGPYAGATTIDELKGAVFGAADGDIAYQITVDSIAPTAEVQVFNNLSDVFAALNTGQIDCCVTSLLTANYVVEIEGEQIENGVILGTIPGSEEATGGLGLLLPKDSPLTEAVSKAIDELREDGTLDALAAEWLNDITYPVLK